MTAARRLESHLLTFNFFWHFVVNILSCMILETITTTQNSHNPGISKSGLPLCSILLNKTKIVEIWTKFFISLVILKAQKRQTTFCNLYQETRGHTVENEPLGFKSKQLNFFFGIYLYAVYWVIISVFRKCHSGNFEQIHF